jgi:hypothetical protein
MFNLQKIDLRKSNLLFCFLTLIHLLAIVLILACPVSRVIKGVFTFLIASHYAWALYEYVFRLAASSLQSLRWDGQQWLLVCNDGSYCAQLMHDSVVTHWLVLLRFRLASGGKSRVAVIFNDAADTDELRRMRVFLRHIYKVEQV